MSDVQSITPKSVSLEDQRILAAKIRDVATYQANDMIGNASLAASGEVQRQCDANHLDHRGRRALSETVCAKLGDRGTDIVPWRSELVSLLYEKIIDRLTKAPDGEPALREALHGQAGDVCPENADGIHDGGCGCEDKPNPDDPALDQEPAEPPVGTEAAVTVGGPRPAYPHRMPDGKPFRLHREDPVGPWQVLTLCENGITERLWNRITGPDDEMEAVWEARRLHG